MSNQYLVRASCIVVIAILTALLYIPFLSNSLVFDDHGVFSTLIIYDKARTPLDLLPRTFPYFTLGLVQVLIGKIEAQRLINLILHIFCAWMLFALITNVLHQVLRKDPSRKEQINKQAISIASILGIWFAIHPVAVYGAGYLVQRTILFATLFSLLSLWFYHRAFAENRTADVVSSALFYSAAVFSKEHALMLPLATITLTALYSGDFQLKAKRIGLYLIACGPAALIIVFATKYLVATSYESHVSILFDRIDGIPLLKEPLGPWLVSMIMQAGFFFDYFSYWLIPDIRTMSIDMRINFSQIWMAWWTTPKAVLFLACPIAALLFLRRGGLIALFGCGFLYSWLLFLTELAAVRFQEPFVLYRSYLWAPGYALMLTAICCAFQLRWIATASIPILAVCIWLAHDRLASLANETSVWIDAAAKLESKSIVGAGRILYMRGRQYTKEKRLDEAIADLTDAMPHYPAAAAIYYQRGIAFYSKQEFKSALADFEHALTLNKNDGPIQYARGLALEGLGCFDAAARAYATSFALGHKLASLKLSAFEKKRTRPDTNSCPSVMSTGATESHL